MNGPMTNLSVLKIHIDNFCHKKQDIFIDFEKNFYREDKKFVWFGSDDCDHIFFTNEDFDYYTSKIRQFFGKNNLTGKITVIKDGKLIKKKFKYTGNDRKANPIGD